jgi:hypothetical protein
MRKIFNSHRSVRKALTSLSPFQQRKDQGGFFPERDQVEEGEKTTKEQIVKVSHKSRRTKRRRGRR